MSKSRTENIGPREDRRAYDRQVKWLIDTDRKPRTPERVAELKNIARKTAERHGRGQNRGGK